MNIFTTEHPLDCQSDDKTPVLLSYFRGMVLAAAILCPFFAVGIWFIDVGDNGGSTGGYTPAPFWVDLLVAAVLSIFTALVCTSMVALLSWAVRRSRSYRHTLPNAGN